ncbi:hypothetical protein H0H87_011035 [Tephrocybe sp. NHM501043]|nr:hypothetical protein H0H87_011035 [Tephrocybe sp. NHM501043]
MATSGTDDSNGLHTVTELTTSLAIVTVHDDASQTEPVTIPQKKASSYRPMRIYTRPQILLLYNSPLVQLPPGMPELKDWFGSENEQNLSKKESDPTTPGSARERRCAFFASNKTPSRPTFRSALSQPSQMGNFKHQSLRSNDREREKDRDRDGDKDRERDIRDKEGHERLRHLSDKYDRDRLALPLSARPKEREAAPHLSAGSSSRLGGQTQTPMGSSRRGDTREVIKKKAGEASEDWRKGLCEILLFGLPSHTLQDQIHAPQGMNDTGIDVGRKDRDDRGKSHVRDSSRSRRENSPSRRERERELEREFEDDPRRWRDDGKRDERIAARRTVGHGERLREKDIALDSTDRRWVAGEDRESRMKRSTGRDRKPGALTDEGKDRDDRRDREREKEKEPAWMDTYVPSSSSGGILGGKTGDGELDGIQAWKKERKEKEMKDKADASSTADSSQDPLQKPDATGNSLDEIQIFRLLMKKEEEKKRSDGTENNSQTSVADSEKTAAAVHHSLLPSNGTLVRDNSALTPGHLNGDIRTLPTHSSSQPEAHSVPAPTLLSLLGAKETAATQTSQIPSDTAKSSFPITDLPVAESSSENTEVYRDLTPQFNPPPGSRLLAFARTAPKPSNVSSNVALNGAPPNLGLLHQELSSAIPPKADNNRSLSGFSPFDHQRPPSHGPEESRGPPTSPDINRRTTGAFTPPTEHSQHLDPSSDSGNGFSANKGSRFAKFFDAKGREGSVALSKSPAGLVSSSPGPTNQRQEHGFGSQGNGPDPRAMDEIYAMLSSSAQGSRGAPLHPNATPMPNSGAFGLQPQSNLHIIQQHQAQQHHIHGNRLEPLYDSRLDDRNFVPDGMVPGLRAVPPPRNRDNPTLYPENMEDMPFNVQPRLPHQQQRNFEQLYSGVPPSLYGQQGGRNPGIPMQANQYRGGPSPLSHQHSHVPSSQQRLPPGLANLGGRPPHEPSLGMAGMPNSGLHNGIHLDGSQQQPFNNFPPGGNLGYGSGPPIRSPHQLQNQGAHLPMGGHPNNLNLRTAGQNQLLGLSGASGLRGAGGFFPGQQAPGGQMPQLLAMRQQQQQQQQQQLPPHMMTHVLPPHMQHHGPASSQPTQDLMTLLMGGSHRE